MTVAIVLNWTITASCTSLANPLINEAATVLCFREGPSKFTNIVTMLLLDEVLLVGNVEVMDWK